ncbi:MAG: tol-pal system YbgF family protein, partial [Armatimonadota bacterium]
MWHCPMRWAGRIGLVLVALPALWRGPCSAQEEEARKPPDEVLQAVRAVRHFQELEVLPEDAPDLPSVDDLVGPLSVLQKAAEESPDLDARLLALLYAIDCYRSLGDQAEEARATERFFGLLQERREEQTAWRHVNAYAQHRLFRGLRVVSFTNAWGRPEEKLFDTELVQQAAQAYEKLAAWFPESDLGPKALDKAAWIFYACLNDYDTAIPLCERIANQWPDTDYHLRAEWRLGMM